MGGGDGLVERNADLPDAGSTRRILRNTSGGTWNFGRVIFGSTVDSGVCSRLDCGRWRIANRRRLR
jgi:hypothetical protein